MPCVLLQVSLVLHALVSYVLSCLTCLVPYMLSCHTCHFTCSRASRISCLMRLVLCLLSYLTCSCALSATRTSCLESFMCQYHLFCSCFPMLQSFFGKFTTVIIKIICRYYFEVMVNINQQYDVLELYLKN